MICTLDRTDEAAASDAIARQLATIALDRRTTCRTVDAFVRHGCVTLTGIVDAPSNRIAAEAAVRSVPGIVRVLNQIEVAGSG